MDKKLIALLIISMSVFSAHVHAASEQHAVNAVKVDPMNRFIEQVSNLIPLMKEKKVATTQADSKSKSKQTQFGFRADYKKMIQVENTGATGMFRRVVNAPGAGTGGTDDNTVDTTSSKVNKATMKLSATVPAGLGLAEKDYVWLIKFKKIKVTKKGKSITATLPEGKYTVKLTVGGISTTKTVNLGTAGATSNLGISLGRVKSSVSFDGGGTAKSRWTVYKMKGSKRGGKVSGAKKGASLSRVLKPGKYELVVKLGSIKGSKVITIKAGKVAKASIHLQGATVKLMVTKSDLKSPLMQEATWTIKEQPSNRIILTKKRHSATVTLAPGKYTASATSGGITKNKSFVVKLGKESRVALAME
jgi:hypothetical protein